jgi:hypothetical protein
MSLSNILLIPGVGGASHHPDVNDWRTRIAAEGGTANATTLSALDTFARSIETAGLRSKIWRLNVFCGSNLDAALTPFYNSPTTGAAAEGFTIDQNNGPFVTADWSESGGLVNDGTKYLNTGLTPGEIGVNDGMMAFDCVDSSVTLGGFLDTWDATGRASLFAFSGPSVGFRWHGTQSASSATSTNGFFVGIRNATNYRELFKDGSSIATNTSGTTDAPLIDSIYIMARNPPTGTGAITALTTKGYAVGNALTSGEVSAFYSAWTTLQASLGR